MEFHEITLKPFPPIRYKTRDGKIFTNKFEYFKHESEMQAKQRIWYEKRFSLFGELMYFLFKKEPKGRQY